MSHSCSVESGVFGVPIHVLLHRDSQRVENLKVPLFLQETLEFLEKNGIDCEGILRVPGSSVRMKVCWRVCGRCVDVGVYQTRRWTKILVTTSSSFVVHRRLLKRNWSPPTAVAASRGRTGECLM